MHKTFGLPKWLWDRGKSLTLKDCSGVVTPCIFHTLRSARISWELCNVMHVFPDCGASKVFVMYHSQSCVIYIYFSNMHWMQTAFRLKSAVERFTWFTVAAVPRKHDEIQIFKAKIGLKMLDFKATYCTNSTAHYWSVP